MEVVIMAGFFSPGAAPDSSAAPPLVWLGRLLLVVGAALVLAAAICFFAWNWRSLSDTAKFALAVGGFLACVAGSLAAERHDRSVPADLALLAACLFMGMFWVVFGQTFQSGATAQDFCLVWAACVTPFVLLRRTASLWNLWAVLLLAAVADKSLATGSPLPPLALAAALCGIAVVPPGILRRKQGLNAWLALPLTALLALGTGYTLLLIVDGQLAERYPALMAGPAVLLAALIPAVRSRNPLAMGEFGLVGLVLLNACLAKLMLTSPTATDTTTAGIFTVGNIAYTLLLVAVMPGLFRRNAAVRPSAADSLPAEQEPDPGRPRRRLFPTILAGLGGVVSACFLVSFTAALFGLRPGRGFIVLGILYMIAGALVWRSRRRGVFVLTLAPILAAAGAFFYESALSAFFYHSPGSVLIGKWLAAVALYLAMDCAPLRFGTVLWAILATFQFFNILPEPVAPAVIDALGLVCLLPLVLAAWGRPIVPESLHTALARRLRPAAFAAIWAVFPLLPLFQDIFGRHSYGTANALRLPAGLITALCAANLVLLAWRSPLLRATRRLPGFALPVAGSLTLSLLCFFAPAETLLALNLVLVGKFAAHAAERKWYSLPLFMTGLLLLAASLGAFYYQLEIPFPDKIPRMGIPGLCLLAGGILLERSCGQPRSALSRHGAPAGAVARRAAPLALTAVLMPVLFFAAAADRRAILRDGSDCLLELAPRDPRAFMLGDYMELRYDLERQLAGWKAGPGCLPLKLDEHGVVPGVAWPDETLFMPEASCDRARVPALTIEQHDRRAVARLPRRYYFEEGLAGLYEDACYAVLRCDKRNRCLLAGLADRSGRMIEPDATSARAE